MGAYVATTASDEGYELVESLGADEIINYKKQDFEGILKNYDAVFDTLGGEKLEKSFTVLKARGGLFSLGIAKSKICHSKQFRSIENHFIFHCQ